MKHDFQIGNYKHTYKDFNLDVPKRFNWAYEVFDKWSEDPEKLAMLWVGMNGIEREVTFRELGERSRRVANALSALGMKPGDSVFIMLPRLVEWWELILGCMRARLVSVPGTTQLTVKDLRYRIGASEAKIVITDVDNLPKVEHLRADCPSLEHVIVVGTSEESGGYEALVSSSSTHYPNPQNLATDPLVVYFTSGTTGNPKMVLNTHSTYPIGHITTGKFWLDNRPTDLHWTLADTGWAQAAWSHFFGPWNMGAAIFVWDDRGRFDPKATLGMIEKYPITTFFAPPTAFRMLVLEDLESFRPKALRHCVGAGEPLNPELIEIWRNGTGFHIYEGYGQTETTLCIATFPGIEYKPGSMGVAAPGYVIEILDENGQKVRVGEEGEIAIRIHPERPVGLFAGYWNDLEANKNCFRGDWYFTGDRASRDEDGYYWFVGRMDDVIISSSYRIGPFEVESALLEHESVAEAAVIGSSDDIRGQIVKAFVVLVHGWDGSDSLAHQLQEHVKRVTAPYKYPREIEFLEELPKTISGKIRRNELRRIDQEQKIGRL